MDQSYWEGTLDPCARCGNLCRKFGENMVGSKMKAPFLFLPTGILRGPLSSVWTGETEIGHFIYDKPVRFRASSW